MNEKYTENKGCAGLRSNPAHPLFSDFFHRQCVSHIDLLLNKLSRKISTRIALRACGTMDFFLFYFVLSVKSAESVYKKISHRYWETTQLC